MIEKIDHVGIAVKSIDEALKVYRDVLGIQVKELEQMPTQKLAMLPVGESMVELLEAITPDAAVAKFIESRGEGIHHIALRVDNIEQALAEAKAAGLRLIDETPRTGAGGSKIAFIHPKSVYGVMIELVERHGDH
ncbi:MAG: methylmalonyl-CoA epimerase [Chloroflexota bacterium]